MGTARREERGRRTRGNRGEVFPHGDATSPRVQDLAHYGHLDLVDVVAYTEGKLVGFHTGVPYDWSVLDGELMRSEAVE